MTEAEMIRLGEQAEEMINSNVWQTITAGVVSEMFEEWRTADPKTAKKLHREMTAFQTLVGEVEATIYAGKVVKEDLDNE